MSTTGALSTTILYLVRMEINHPRLIFPRNPTVRPMSFDYSVDMNTYDANDASSSTSSSFPLHVVHVEPFFVQIFRRFRPMKSCRVPKEIKEICDGNSNPTTFCEPFEYISNQALEEALVEELQNGPNVSLAAISSCLSQHVDPNISDSSSSSSSSNRPLHYAAKYGNSKLTALLLGAGANIDQVNALGQTPLMIACQFISRRHFACAELLISRACNMELRDKGGSNALEQAITASNVACVKLLLGNGCQLSCALGDRGPDISSRSTLFEQPDESSVLALAESVRARSVGMEIEDANALFAELEDSGGPSFLDRIRRSRLCSPSHLVVGVVKVHCSPLSLKVQSAPPRRSKRTEKYKLGFVGRAQAFLQKSIARKGIPRRKSSKHEKKSRQRQIRSTKKRPLHERKAQSHEIDDEHKEKDVRSYSRKTDDVRRRKKEKDSRSRGEKRTQRRTSNEHRSSDTTISNLSASRAARSSRRPNERHRRRRRKDDRIRRKRQSAMRLNRNGEDVVQYQ